ncbi:MAG TPA: bifunctional phosphoribosyl-AMP cyclohydrolase/phosphoribosyl-ATP diphosphatase HisIE [Anaerolineaceae bacterium]
MNVTNFPNIHYNADGLLPVIVQDHTTGQVLMLAYMNQEALERSLQTGQTWFWSRSRSELWHKGETSGNIQEITSIAYDCDSDALLVKVKPAGPACHTGETSCFYRFFPQYPDQPSQEFSLETLYEIICDRRDHPSEQSYTSRLLAEGEDEVIKKVGEEAAEVILAAARQGNRRLIEETADLTYHALVLLAARRLSPADILEELAKRHKPVK